MADNKLYKIQNSSGQFSSGGTSPTFTREGKSWKIGQLKSHLRLVGQHDPSFKCYSNCELITFTYIITPAIINLNDLTEPLEREISEKLEERKRRYGF